MGKPCVGGQLERATRPQHRDSLDIFGQTTIFQAQAASGCGGGVHGSDGPLFSRAPGSAWNSALRVAENLLHDSQPRGGRHRELPAGNRGEVKSTALAAEDRVEISLDELIAELEVAEEDATRTWQSLVENMDADDGDLRYSSGSFDHGYYDGRDRGSSDSWGGLSSGVPEEVISERAAQWGYGVVLKNSRDSTPRSSAGSSTGASGGSAAQQAIPSVSRDVKDALASFQLAFLVCDATDHDFPILYASAGFTTMTGYSGDEIVGKNCRFLQGIDTDRWEITKLREALKVGGTYTGTVLNYKKDGTPFWNLLTISPIKDDYGKVIKYIGMQAEQNSKEQRPRNAKGQKSPFIRPMHGPMATTPDAQRRHSANGLPRPPVAPQRASPNGERHLFLEQQQPAKPSQRYSLSSNPAKVARNSSIAIDESPREPDRREAALRLRSQASAGGSSKGSSFEYVSSGSRLSSDQQRSKSGRLTTRLLRIFSTRRESKESKRRSRSETVKSGEWNSEEFSDSEEDGDDGSSASSSVRNSGSRRRPSAIYAPSRAPGSHLRREASVDELCQRLQEHFTEDGHQRAASPPPPPPPFDSAKRQFCIVHS